MAKQSTKSRAEYTSNTEYSELENRLKSLRRTERISRRLKNGLISILLVSAVLFGTGYLLLAPPPLQEPETDRRIIIELLLSFVPALALVATISGAIIAWRVERRASEKHRLEMEKLLLEIAKLRLPSPPGS
jgi:hypothetical protein